MVNSGSLGSSVGNSGSAEANGAFVSNFKGGSILFVLQKLNAFWKHMLRSSFSLLS